MWLKLFTVITQRSGECSCLVARLLVSSPVFLDDLFFRHVCMWVSLGSSVSLSSLKTCYCVNWSLLVFPLPISPSSESLDQSLMTLWIKPVKQQHTMMSLSSHKDNHFWPYTTITTRQHRCEVITMTSRGEVMYEHLQPKHKWDLILFNICSLWARKTAPLECGCHSEAKAIKENKKETNKTDGRHTCRRIKTGEGPSRKHTVCAESAQVNVKSSRFKH